MNFFDNYDGWFDFAEIYDHAVATANDGDVLLETGTWAGKSYAYLLNAARESGKKLDCRTVDIRECENWIEIIANFPNAYFIEGDSIRHSEEYDDASLHMVFLDSCHDGDFVYREMCAWYPKVKPGGVFAGHDWHDGYPGLVASVQRFAKENGLTVKAWGSSWVLV